MKKLAQGFNTLVEVKLYIICSSSESCSSNSRLHLEQCRASNCCEAGMFQGQKKATASCHTPNRVYTK